MRVIKKDMLNGGQMPADLAKQMTHAMLLSVAVRRGYKPGWAGMKYKAIYGAWPPWGEVPEPQNPSGELMWWIRKQGKEYAKAKRAAEAPAAPQPKPESALMSEDDWGVEL